MLDSENQRLELIRLREKLDKQAFAKKLGFNSPASYTKIATGQKRLSINAVHAIIDNPDFNWLNLDWLLRGRGLMDISDQKNIIGNNNQVITGNGSSGGNYNTTNEELIATREQLKSLQEQMKLKDEIIQLLKEK